MAVVKSRKSAVRHKVMLALDRKQHHGYYLFQLLTTSFRKLPKASFYRWLNEMEEEGLVESSIEPGPHGPDRKVYSLGDKGETYLRSSLRDAIETIMHFYDGYRHSLVGHMDKYVEEADPPEIDGRILFAAFSQLTDRDLRIVDVIARRRDGQPIDVMCETALLEKTKVRFRKMNGRIDRIPVGDETFSEVWMLGLPSRRSFPSAVSESKRILAEGGFLRIIAPFVFFQPPEKPTLSEFIRVTAVHLFPELGFVEGNEAGSVIESYFSKCGANEAFPGFVLFWAKKTESDE